MTDEAKQEEEVVLMLLKNTLVSNGVSIAIEKKDDGCIMFFDTAEYCRTGKFKGIEVEIGVTWQKFIMTGMIALMCLQRYISLILAKRYSSQKLKPKPS